ncbi:hypothetical protein [Emticicia sp. BO119]|uniref:hypothetical protein n=1 Tax=Emticicia sp. BO119 TaxID=2757768 RepID=UPI0015F00FD9|nr:hypothetical protein [Emticicia sp. BO119]MBA4852616.1 hypothetical protein [Emticicia sp. BO119]
MKKILLLLITIVSFQAKAQFIEASTDSFKTKVPVRMMNIGEGAGKVLTSDALGRASWQTPASLWTTAGIGGTEIRNTNPGGFWSSYSTLVPITADNTSNPPTAPVAGGGTRMMWIPSRSAFRCGSVNGSAWDANNIGLHSFATGYNSWASGIGNVAIGTGAISDGTSNTIAIGENSHASGNGNMAFGIGAISDGTSNTIAIGENAHASGNGGMAFGVGAFADGSVRTIAIGENTHAYGNNSTAIGTGTVANSYYSVALGYYNSPIGAANATSWVSTDPLLYIGNGQNAGSPSNAMVIQKNGVVNINTTPNNSTTYRLRLGGSMSATGTVQASVLRSTALSGSGERHVCTDESGNLIECSTSQLSYYNVSALGFHPILSANTPSTAFLRIVEKALIAFANDTKSADAYAFAPVELPDGAYMGKMIMHYIQNTGGNMTLTFYSVEKQTNAVGTVEASISSAMGSGIQEKQTGFDKNLVIDNSKFYYYLKLEASSNWQGTNLALRGVIFSYSK